MTKISTMRDDIIELNGTIQMCKRYWWQLYKKGWHKHETMIEKVWIRYNWNVTDTNVGKIKEKPF